MRVWGLAGGGKTGGTRRGQASVQLLLPCSQKPVSLEGATILTHNPKVPARSPILGFGKETKNKPWGGEHAPSWLAGDRWPGTGPCKPWA